jgi:hypothetical protein
VTVRFSGLSFICRRTYGIFGEAFSRSKGGVLMAYVWKGKTFQRFDEAVVAWFGEWREGVGACWEMADRLEAIAAADKSEWEREATRDINRFHCGMCAAMIPVKHNGAVTGLLKDIKEIH